MLCFCAPDFSRVWSLSFPSHHWPHCLLRSPTAVCSFIGTCVSRTVVVCHCDSPNLGFTCQLAAWGEALKEWSTPRDFGRCMVYEIAPHSLAFREGAAARGTLLEEALVPFAVHDGPGRVGGSEGERALQASPANAGLLHGTGCFLVQLRQPSSKRSDGSATSRQTSVWHSSGLCVWVGSACTGRLRDAMIASAQRAARHLIELDWTAGPPRSIDGSRLDGGAHPVPVLPQGLSRLSRLSASVVCQPLRRSASGSPLLALVACYYKRKYISTHALARQNALPNWYCLLLPAACARAH